MATVTYNGSTHTFSVGDYVSELLYTDTVVHEIIKTTDKTITCRETKRDGVAEDECSFMYYYCRPNEEGRVRTLRLRTDKETGNTFFSFDKSSRPYAVKIPRTINGRPVSRYDKQF